MPDETCVPDELTPAEELKNIISFARVIVALPSTGDMAKNYAESIILAGKRLQDATEEPC